MTWTFRRKSGVLDDKAIIETLKRSRIAVRLDFESEEIVDSELNRIKFQAIIGVGVARNINACKANGLPELRGFVSKADDFVLGYFSYDLKNTLENLGSQNPNSIGFPAFHFFVPKNVYLLTEDGWVCYSHGNGQSEKETLKEPVRLGAEFNSISKEMYCHQVENLQQHIQFGDIYEVNYCVQHGFENTVVEPYRLYQELQQNSPAPFSCFVADNGKYLMSSSPERFMRKQGNRIISQPMKGTNRRTSDNEKQKEELRNNAKEVAENVMITDLVRNDLSRSAKKGTVQVDELCGVYEFEHVNAMISTVSAEVREDVHPLDALLNAFPMGSMTGAPKIRAMELIDQF
ncbi:MAG: chorismate-binding protein, partial [Flavobacteriales bacterium]|nr:chorismate-binding protein [Flavobacteriales bacterium]